MAFEFGPYRAVAPARAMVPHLASFKGLVQLRLLALIHIACLFTAKDQLQRFTLAQK
ncbi:MULTISPECIES: hypothetical protein [unclassified Aerococcus]|uniref:hypothetical protein n=1 Tax=unclassified Aerococcus TaxID=2618060 RepID=UPI0014397DC1|nr:MULTISPECIES: hypothetical protein [unclassified Aerococcus]MDK6687216.1 hypothetical protein [Aerococcus sp. UMB8623]MDK6941086.1 hypothetical protein [Aerococcus sp. UMB8487]